MDTVRLNNYTSLFLIVLILEVSHQQKEQVAVAGVSTNINILCNLDRDEEAPFWFINNTAYELFSIPFDFPYIPTVNSFSQLTIPVVVLELDNTLFQCASYEDNGSVNHGKAELLSVMTC